MHSGNNGHTQSIKKHTDSVQIDDPTIITKQLIPDSLFLFQLSVLALHKLN